MSECRCHKDNFPMQTAPCWSLSLHNLFPGCWWWTHVNAVTPDLKSHGQMPLVAHAYYKLTLSRKNTFGYLPPRPAACGGFGESVFAILFLASGVTLRSRIDRNGIRTPVKGAFNSLQPPLACGLQSTCVCVLYIWCSDISSVTHAHREQHKDIILNKAAKKQPMAFIALLFIRA